MNLNPNTVLSASPYFQTANTKNKGGCQIDLLIETKDQIFYLCEIKSARKVDMDAIHEINKKAKIFQRPKYSSLKKVLIYSGELDESVLESEELNHLISFESLWGLH